MNFNMSAIKESLVSTLETVKANPVQSSGIAVATLVVVGASVYGYKHIRHTPAKWVKEKAKISTYLVKNGNYPVTSSDDIVSEVFISDEEMFLAIGENKSVELKLSTATFEEVKTFLKEHKLSFKAIAPPKV